MTATEKAESPAAAVTADEVARTFGISIGSEGFFLEEHPKLEPVSTPTSGVFLAGACQGPKDIPDTVAQAKGAASEALALASRGEVEVEPLISSIDPDLCIGCQVCIGLCPYSAIEFDEVRDYGEVFVISGSAPGRDRIEVRWPSGATRVLRNPEIRRYHYVAPPEGVVAEEAGDG